MGIDRIGKQTGIAPQATEVGGPTRAGEADRPFEGSRPAPPRPADAVQGPPTSLDRLRAGEIDLTGYLELKVDESTAHLVELPAADLSAIRSALRDRLASDPALVDLVRSATGAVPHPPPDE